MVQTALITGASTGIGRELAKLFGADGYNLVLVARREAELTTLASELKQRYGIQASIITADLKLATATDTIFKFTQDNKIDIDVLVNNAGFGANGAVADLDAQMQLDIIHVNIATLVSLTKLYLPGMLARGTGGVLNLGSTAAFAPGPFMAVYYASKAFVLSFSEALRNECKNSGVIVSCLCPGPTATEFQAVAKLEQGRLFKSGLVMNAATVAKIGFTGFKQNKGTVICGLSNRLGAFASRFVAREALASITRMLQEPPPKPTTRT